MHKGTERVTAAGGMSTFADVDESPFLSPRPQVDPNASPNRSRWRNGDMHGVGFAFGGAGGFESQHVPSAVRSTGWRTAQKSGVADAIGLSVEYPPPPPGGFDSPGRLRDISPTRGRPLPDRREPPRHYRAPDEMPPLPAAETHRNLVAGLLPPLMGGDAAMSSTPRGYAAQAPGRVSQMPSARY